MRKVIYYSLAGLFLLMISADLFAQNVTIDGVFRPRFENRHGYGTIFPEDAKAANFVSQRSRLGIKFANDKFKVGFSLQNVGVWGETGTLSKYDINGTAVHEAWGEVLFSKMFSLKAGRQEIIYDDQRIFGNVDWAQQGRSHDAAIFTINPNDNNHIDVGIAYNALQESLYKQDYMRTNYKTLQYVHWHGSFGKFGISALALNNGMPYQNLDSLSNNGDAHFSEKVAFSRTVGPRLSFENDLIQTNLAYYSQFGKRTVLGGAEIGGDTTMKISAIYFGIDIYFKLAKMFTIGAGYEFLSGNNEKDNYESGLGKEVENAFTPFYGTNHKFNGWMDYFYVGNHSNSVGLTDLYFPFKFKKDKISAMIIPHIFSTASVLYRSEKDDGFNDTGVMKEYGRFLGTELDFAFGYAFTNSVEIKAGYSVMFATESLEVLKDTQKDKANIWGWVMLVFKPTFYNSENHK